MHPAWSLCCVHTAAGSQGVEAGLSVGAVVEFMGRPPGKEQLYCADVNDK